MGKGGFQLPWGKVASPTSNAPGNVVGGDGEGVQGGRRPPDRGRRLRHRQEPLRVVRGGGWLMIGKWSGTAPTCSFNVVFTDDA